MPKYRLNIIMNEKDLPILYRANQKLIIVKRTPSDSNSQVAWITFAPFMCNTIDWQTEYSLYASNCEIQDGAVINKLSDTIAIPQIVYKFKEGIFQEPVSDSTIGHDTYAVRHELPDYPSLTFGLAQSVMVNGRVYGSKPINAVCVPFGQMVAMTTLEKVDIFLSSDVQDSAVISNTRNQKLTVNYGEETDHTVIYNGETGLFFIEQ